MQYLAAQGWQYVRIEAKCCDEEYTAVIVLHTNFGTDWPRVCTGAPKVQNFVKIVFFGGVAFGPQDKPFPPLFCRPITSLLPLFPFLPSPSHFLPFFSFLPASCLFFSSNPLSCFFPFPSPFSLPLSPLLYFSSPPLPFLPLLFPASSNLLSPIPSLFLFPCALLSFPPFPCLPSPLQNLKFGIYGHPAGSAATGSHFSRFLVTFLIYAALRCKKLSSLDVVCHFSVFIVCVCVSAVTAKTWACTVQSFCQLWSSGFYSYFH